MPYTPPEQRLCDCRCPLHHRGPRTTYDEPTCSCAITCATQPMTLLLEQWNCALFLDPNGNMLYVNALAGGAWAWDTTGQIDSRYDYFEMSQYLERVLRQVVQTVAPTLD